MMVYGRFPGDDNMTAMLVQNKVYSEVIAKIVGEALRRYVGACVIVDVVVADRRAAETILSGGFDHRTVQDAHDLIAAWYRYRRNDPSLFPEAQQEYEIQREWLDFARNEVLELVEDPLFVRSVANAVIHATAERGIRAESDLRSLLEKRYRQMYVPRPVGGAAT
jgi:hypothetical protein